jgi:hypothetical protein
MPRRRPFLAALTLLVLACVVPPGLARGAELAVVGPSSVSVGLSVETSEAFSVWIENTTRHAIKPRFATVLEDGTGKRIRASVETVGGATEVGADRVARFRLLLQEASKSAGRLTAYGPGVSPASVELTVAPHEPSDRGVNKALLYPLAAALAVLGLAVICSAGKTDFLGEVGVAELEFSSSFASALTAVGALLGTIITAGVLPEETVHFSKAGFTGLNLTFGIAILVAAIVYSGLQRSFVEEEGGKKEWKLKGFVIPYLLAALITLWAVFGEVWTLGKLVEELGEGQGFSNLAVTMIQVMLIAAVAMVPYTVVRVKDAIRRSPGDDTAPATASPRAVGLL